MTKDELIQKAIECLKKNKVEKDMLESPRVHEATAVYFKMKDQPSSPDSYIMMLLDSQTGEQLSTHFAPDPFLHQGPIKV